jgi:class 3 adenylate cyclase
MPEFRMRIGLHHGPVVAGMFGGHQRSDFTAIGSTVNMAARIEGVCREDQVFIAGERFNYLLESAAEPVGRYKLKGIGEVNLYQLVRPET